MYYPDLSPRFLSLLRTWKKRKVIVRGHLRPDGDCIGSQVGLVRVLRSEGIDAVAVNTDEVPKRLQFAIGDTPYRLWADCEDLDGGIVVNVDVADPQRVGEEFAGAMPDVEVNIDHHVSNNAYGRHNFIDSRSAATAEIIAGMVLDNGIRPDAAAAQALYVGIATDTGQFRFPSTSYRVFEICARLVAMGADPAASALELYEKEPFGRLNLLKEFLSTFELSCGGRVCIGLLKKGVFERTGTTQEDTEGLVDYARSIDGVDIALLLEEKNGSIKGSFRAKEERFRVDRLAARFGGGGHACAAGFNIEGVVEDVLPEVRRQLADFLASLDNKS